MLAHIRPYVVNTLCKLFHQIQAAGEHKGRVRALLGCFKDLTCFLGTIRSANTNPGGCLAAVIPFTLAYRFRFRVQGPAKSKTTPQDGRFSKVEVHFRYREHQDFVKDSDWAFIVTRSQDFSPSRTGLLGDHCCIAVPRSVLGRGNAVGKQAIQNLQLLIPK